MRTFIGIMGLITLGLLAGCATRAIVEDCHDYKDVDGQKDCKVLHILR